MVYTILISIVFIAEIIITITVLQNLMNLDKKILEYNELILSTKNGIKDISVLIRKISNQIKDLIKEKISEFRLAQEEALVKQISKLLLGVLVLKLNIKFINNFRKTRLSKVLAKGLSLLEIMV